MEVCACIGAMYGEPYCYCEMKRMGLAEVMEKNPLRAEENKRFKEHMNRFFEKDQCRDK